MRKNLVIAFTQRHLQLLVSIASVVILSRLITPEETGIFSIGVAIAALTHAIRDFGVGNFLVKEAEISDSKIQTAFTVSLLIAVTLSFVLFGISFPVADFYKSEDVAKVIWITTFGLLLSPLSTIPLALMLRNHRFVDMFKVSMASSLANAGVAILCGWLGFGAIALALGQLASSVALAITANLILRERSIYRICLAHWQDISRFGMHMTISGVSEQMGQRASDLIVGKMVGFGPVGLLSRSGTLVTMVQDSVQSAVMPVVLTSMSSDVRKSANVLPLLLKSLCYFSAVMWPVYAVLSLFSYDAISVLFGAKWLEAAPYTSILCYGAMLAVLSSLVSTTCNATNNAHLLSRYSPTVQGIRVLLVTIGAFTGDLGIVVRMLVLAEALQCLLAFLIIRSATSVQLGQVLRSCWRSALLALLVGASMAPILYLDYPSVVRLIIVAPSAAAAWLAAVYITRHPIAEEVSHLFATLSLRLRAHRAR